MALRIKEIAEDAGVSIATVSRVLNDSQPVSKDLRDRVIVCNPPYGIRLTSPNGMEAFYRALGDFLKRRCAGSTAFIYFGDRVMLKHIGLKPAWKRPLKNGGLDGRLAKFELYA